MGTTITAESLCKFRLICVRHVASSVMSHVSSSTMPPNRKVLGPISGNIQKKRELNLYQRGKIITTAELGLSNTEIGKAYNHLESTVRKTISQDKLRNQGRSLPRSGRPKKYTAYDERVLLRHVRLNPKDTYAQVRAACSLRISNTTIRNILSHHGITNWRAKKRPELTEEVVAKRYSWCCARRNWKWKEWKVYMFSDKCLAEQEKGRPR